jgi:polyisoprenoid-binding protein YceI
MEKKMRNRSLVLAIGVATLVGTPALADTWNIDGKHSQASFKIRHMMVSNVNGTITGIKGSADYDGKNVNNLKVDAVLDVNTINTSESGRDEHLKSADFFDAAKYPTITFKSKRVEKKADGQFQLIGDLTMKGVTKEVAMDVEGPTAIIKDGKGVEHIGASAKASINRKDFGIEYNKVLEAGGVAVGEKVDISLDVELLKPTEDNKKASR